MCGGFNARVGVLDEDSSLWQSVLGRHGKSERNLAGHELLECHQQPIHYEQLVSEERNTSGYLDSSCNQEVSCDRLCGDESLAKGFLPRCESHEGSKLLDGPHASMSKA